MTTVPTDFATAGSRRRAVQRGRRLQYVTLVWNSLEALAAIISGVLARSIALIAFGFDSVIEVTSGLAALWRLHADAGERREPTEQIVLRIVGLCFLALALYVTVDAVMSLASREAPRQSLFGIGLAIASLVAMPLLARAKRRVAASLNSAALHADSRQTDICAYLSAILLGGLGLNFVFGWWWADPVAALVMAPLIAREGVQALRGKEACGCRPA